MLKPLSLSVSLAVALGACSLSLAGGHLKTYASGQCETVASPQSVVPSAQSIGEGCGEVCGPVAKKSCFGNLFKHKPKTYTYEWVLKKKRCGGLFGGGCGTATAGGCESCGTALPSAQYPSSQSYGSAQYPTTYSAPQGSYSAPQAGYSAPQSGGMTAAPAAAAAPTMEAPPAPEVAPAPAPAPAPPTNPAPAPPAPAPPTASNGGLQLLPSGN